MKKITKILSLIIISTIVLSICVFNVSAASCRSETSKTTFSVGDTVTVTFYYTSEVRIWDAEGNVSFDPSKLQFKSANVENTPSSSSIFFYDGDLSTGTKDVFKGTYRFVFTAIAEGSTSVSIDMFANTDESSQPATDDHTITIKNPTPSTPSTPSTPPTPSTPTTSTPSSNATLSSLKVSGATLSPSFKSSVTSYTAKVDNTTEKVTISGNAQDGGTCEGFGTFNLKEGENVRYITVTAADGKSKKTYTLTITRASSGEEPVEPVTPTDPLAVTIDDKAYTIVAEVPTAIPTGFESDTVKVNDTDVSVLKSTDGKIVLYTLKNNESGATDYYTYDEEKDEFNLLKYGVINGKMFIFTDNEKATSAKGYEKTTLNLGNSTINAFVSTDSNLSDFYIIYCYVDGKYGYYSYDSVENTIQRAPTFKTLISAEEEKEVISSIKDLPKLSAKGKAVIIVLAVIVICVITLIVLVIVRYIKLREVVEEDNFEFDSGDNLFDEVNIEDNSQNTDDVSIDE